MGIRYVLFDLDGTLFDTSPGILRCIRAALRQCGVPVGEGENLNKFIGPPFLSALKEFYGMDEAQAVRVKDVYRALYAAGGVDECAPMPGARECLEALRGAGLTLAVATSKPLPFALRVLGRFDFLPFFAFVGADDTPTGTEKAEVVGRVLQKLGGPPPEACMMVGDRKYDVLGAAAHGIRCVCYDSGFAEPGEYGRAGACKVASSYAEVQAFLLAAR